MKKSKALFITLVILLAFALINKISTKDQTWEVLFAYMPTKLTIDRATNIKSSYLLKQTHTALFEKDSTGNYKSQFLTSFNRSIDSRKYKLCVKDNLYFDPSKENQFDVNFLKQFITTKSSVLWNKNKLTNISITGHCLDIQFEKSNKVFFYKLSKLIHAPSVTVNENWDAGLGQYKITSISEDKIVLDRKNQVSDGYNKIIAFNVNKFPELKKNKNIEDFNPMHNPPKWVQEKYKLFPITDTQTLNLIFNIEDKDLRNILHNCIDVKKFRRSFVNDSRKFINIANVLPIGFSGSSQSLPHQDVCSANHKFKGKNLKFLNWHLKAQNNLEIYFKDFSKKTGINISVEPLKNSKLADELFAKKHNYDLTTIAINSTDDSYEYFFELFTDKSMAIIDNPLSSINDEVRSVDSLSGLERNGKVSELLTHLKNERVYLPLYQSQSEKYYPKNIKFENYSFSKLLYPPIADFRL